ncbi:DUF6464 family protein [Leptolyngbya iicbica]|uniref:Uncharacterized protein n=2 Tax=Cyanophyceae TaxID=3028117 RepID=A0A4V2E2N7_9CYAN|nr:DUF6464 family protein [Leptolyngbya sp. LK]RZM79196.1 hypothetical protein DYY88_10590 [Leptolyngbya sp. LK]
MDQTLPPTELILNAPPRSLGQVPLDWQPQPGNQLIHDGQVYTVLERRHRYQFTASRYQLHKIDLYVQLAGNAEEKSWLGDRWVLGDISCEYNARSELVRCAVNPDGPCQNCAHYQRRES